MGASAESSMDEPWMKAPAAMITGQSYPGMSQGSGVTKESTGAASWTARQKVFTASGSSRRMLWMMSLR